MDISFALYADPTKIAVPSHCSTLLQMDNALILIALWQHSYSDDILRNNSMYIT